MPRKSIKAIILLICLFLVTPWSQVKGTIVMDGHSHILIKESRVEHTPRGSSIDASINGHTLTVTFLENLGDVQVEITTSTGGTVDYGHIWTPDSYIAYITNTGDYVVTITLGNGDEYYGEFEVTD